MIPASLIYRSDDLRLLTPWKALSKRLFDELVAARQSPSPPSPDDLWSEWRKWDDYQPTIEPNIVPKPTVNDWLLAYEASFASSRTSTLSPYVASVVHLLGGPCATLRVPIVVVLNGGAQVLQLEITATRTGNGNHWLHPAFEHRSADVRAERGQFSEAIASVWTSARGASCMDVFWRVFQADGGQLPDMKLDGPSASAAAYRAFWHLADGKVIDPDVYVLADVTSLDGSIKAVGDLRAKIQAIKNTHFAHNQHTPTLVAAKTVSADDQSALDVAKHWSVVHQVSTVAGLTAIRSCESAAAISYLRHLADSLDQCRLLPRGKRLSEVHVPPHVWKDEIKIDANAHDELPATEKPGHHTGSKVPASNGKPVSPDKPAKQQVRVLWEMAFRDHHYGSPVVLVGDAGFGKTTVLRWTARKLALEAISLIETRRRDCRNVPWPVLQSLDTWAAFEPTQQPRESLIALTKNNVPESFGCHECKAVKQLVEDRLTIAKADTWILLDALDRVAKSCFHKGAERISAIRASFPRLLLTTRETGIEDVPFVDYIKMEAATLIDDEPLEIATKWLGTDAALRLINHLSFHPSLAFVAQSPLLLTFACIVADSNPNQALPETPASFYGAMMRRLADGDWHNTSRLPSSDYGSDTALDLLRSIAWRLFVRRPGVNRFARDTIVEIAKMDNVSGDKADVLIRDLVDRGFFESEGGASDGEQFQFCHATYLEFLASQHLATQINCNTWTSAEVPDWDDERGWLNHKALSLLDTKASDPVWEPVILWSASMIDHPIGLIRLLCEKRANQRHQDRFYRACQCYAQIPVNKENDELAGLMKPSIGRIMSLPKQRDFRWKGMPWRWEESIWCHSRIAKHLSDSLLAEIRHGELQWNHSGWLNAACQVVEMVSCQMAEVFLWEVMETPRMELEKRVRAFSALAAGASVRKCPVTLARLEKFSKQAELSDTERVMFVSELLRTNDEAIATRSFEFLIQAASKTENSETRIAIYEALWKGIGRSCEDQVIEATISAIMDRTLSGDLGGLAQQFLHEIRSHANRPQPDTVTMLMLLFQRHWFVLLIGGEYLLEHGNDASKGHAIELVQAHLNHRYGWGSFTLMRWLYEHGIPGSAQLAVDRCTLIIEDGVKSSRLQCKAANELTFHGVPFAGAPKRGIINALTFASDDNPGDTCDLVDCAKLLSKLDEPELLGTTQHRLVDAIIAQYPKPSDSGWKDHFWIWPPYTDLAFKLLFHGPAWDRLFTFICERMIAEWHDHCEDFPMGRCAKVYCQTQTSSTLLDYHRRLSMKRSRLREPTFLRHIISGVMELLHIPGPTISSLCAHRQRVYWERRIIEIQTEAILTELKARGWDLVVLGRRFLVRQRGREESRAELEFGS